MADWQKIATEAYQVKKQITELEKKFDAILRQDKEYAEYLDAANGRSIQPMSIAAFHRYSDELAALRASAPDCGCRDCGDAFETWWRANWPRVLVLERILLA